MPEATDLKLVQAARDVLSSAPVTESVASMLERFALAELSQEHELSQGRKPKPRLVLLAEDITDGER
ncbi:hypothetical protein [Pseudoclavibacter sp. AY1H1]|uniref:hypothetical protein n=1 Tax=Pseudoclavibacter sp. AY1H1 TaxID=2080584 RepID=UPI0011B0C646|nr:hypothetical protein [Pseudoclavibacter sp. AY1H1]